MGLLCWIRKQSPWRRAETNWKTLRIMDTLPSCALWEPPGLIHFTPLFVKMEQIMETTIWICTGIICISIFYLGHGIDKSLGRIIMLLNDILRIAQYTSKIWSNFVIEPSGFPLMPASPCPTMPSCTLGIAWPHYFLVAMNTHIACIWVYL